MQTPRLMTIERSVTREAQQYQSLWNKIYWFSYFIIQCLIWRLINPCFVYSLSQISMGHRACAVAWIANAHAPRRLEGNCKWRRPNAIRSGKNRRFSNRLRNSPSTANWVQSFRKLRSSNHSLRETNRPLRAANYIDADKETDCKLSSGPSALENYAFIDCKQERNRVCGVQSTPSSRIEIAKLTVEMCS